MLYLNDCILHSRFFPLIRHDQYRQSFGRSEVLTIFCPAAQSKLTNKNRQQGSTDIMIAKFTNKSKQMMKESVPKAYICPLTKEIMIDPLMNRYGVTYERAAIIDHITNQAKPYCPKTKKPLSVRDLAPNCKLRTEIINYRQEVLGEDTTTTTTNYNDDDAIREVEFIRAMMFAFSPPKRPKKGLMTSGRGDLKNMMLRLKSGSCNSNIV
jgi:U-box domain